MNAQRLTPLAVDDLLAVEYPANVVIGADILDVGGLLLVVGPTSVGKSYLLLQLAMHLATATPVTGQWNVPRPFAVYLVQAEIGHKRFQSRVRKLWANMPRTPAPVKFWLESPYDLKLDNADGLAAVEAVVQELGVEVLVIDPLRPFHTKNENASEEMQRLFDSFLRLQFKHGVAIILGHHDRKPSAEGWGRSIYETRGNTIITDRPDSVLRLKPLKGGMTVEAVWEKLRNADRLLPAQKWAGDRSTGLFVPTIEGGLTEDRQKLVTHLLADGGIALRALAEHLADAGGMSVKAAYAEIAALERAGVVEKALSNDGRNQKVVTLVSA